MDQALSVSVRLLLGAAPSPGYSALPSPACGEGGVQGSEAALGPGLATPSLSHAPLTPQVYRLLFGPSPVLDVDSGLPRGQEPWGHLGASSLFRLEVRGLLLGREAAVCLWVDVSAWWVQKGDPWIILSPFWGEGVTRGFVTGVAGGRQDGDVCLPPTPLETLGSLRPGTMGRTGGALASS